MPKVSETTASLILSTDKRSTTTLDHKKNQIYLRREILLLIKGFAAYITESG